MKLLASILAFGLAVLAAIGPAGSATSPVLELVARKAAVLEMLHGKARKALVTAAQDRSFRDYFTTTSATAKARLKSRIDRILLAIQRDFHVEEMCVIGPDGAEVSRIVRNAVAYDLDRAEYDRPFFRPGFELEPRTVYQSAPYMSSDADRWVVGYVTPIVVDGETKAILHYEHNLGVYQGILNKGLTDSDKFLVVIDANGWVISDSRTTIDIGSRGDSKLAADHFRRFVWDGLSLTELRSRLGGTETGEVALHGRSYAVALRPVAGWTLLAAVAR